MDSLVVSVLDCKDPAISTHVFVTHLFITADDLPIGVLDRRYVVLPEGASYEAQN